MLFPLKKYRPRSKQTVGLNPTVCFLKLETFP